MPKTRPTPKAKQQPVEPATAWPLQLIAENLDRKVPQGDSQTIAAALIEGGFGPRLAEFLAPLYAVADKGTFFDGALRMIPLQGNTKKKSLGLIDWNNRSGWLSNAPPKAQGNVYFMSNSFGDQLGVPIDAEMELRKDRVCNLWVDTYGYEASAKPWGEILSMAFRQEHSMDVFLARRKDHDWAKQLGPVNASESYAWDMPPILGGAEDIENVHIGPLALNVSFTLQVMTILGDTCAAFFCSSSGSRVGLMRRLFVTLSIALRNSSAVR
jgi:hypothetical protein